MSKIAVKRLFCSSLKKYVQKIGIPAAKSRIMIRKYLSCTPPMNAMIRNMNRKISTVPSSPCMWISTTGIPMWIKSEITPTKLWSISLSFSSCICFEKVMMKKILTSSEGWKDTPPGRVIHAVSSVPVTFLPMRNTSTSRPSETAASSGQNRAIRS